MTAQLQFPQVITGPRLSVTCRGIELEPLGLPSFLRGLAPQTYLPKDTFKPSFCYDPGPCPPTLRFEDPTETKDRKAQVASGRPTV